MIIIVAIKFVQSSNVSSLEIILKRAKAYNAILYKYTNGNIGKIPVPVKNLKSLLGKYASVDEYIKSEKKWVKLKDFSEEHYTFNNYIDTMIKNWPNIKSILNTNKLSVIPNFNIIMSPKLEKLFWTLSQKEKHYSQSNLYKINKSDSNKLKITMDSEIYALKKYIDLHFDLEIIEIFNTFRRDFSNDFILLVEDYINKGLNKNEILHILNKDIIDE